MALTDFERLPLETIEEACGELHRRLSVALRRIGELAADHPADTIGAPTYRTPRWEVGELVAAFDLAIATFAATVDGSPPPGGRTDRSTAMVAALLYGTPTLPTLLGRLDQNRRMLIALARRVEDRLDVAVPTPWGHLPPRTVLIQLTIEDSARCAQDLEALASRPVDPPIA